MDPTTPVAALPETATSKWWVLFAIGMGTFMTALDTSVVNVILPVVSRTFSSHVAEIEWVVIVYLLVVSGLLLSFGRLGDMRGHRQIYLAGFMIFVVSSALCGMAPSVLSLIIFRAVQAVGAAMLSANSPAILTKSFPPNQRGQALGLQATMTYLGLTVGPSLGGWLTDLLGWRSVFFINIPVGLLAMLVSFRYVPTDQRHRHVEKFDLPGAFTFTAGLIILLLGLNRAHAWGWLSVPTLLSLCLSAVLLVCFVIIELRAAHPMLELNLFRSRLFSASIAGAVLNYICVYSIMFLMPFYLLQGRTLNPSQAGFILSAMPVVMAMVAPVSGTLSDRIGTRLLTAAGMAVLMAGLLLLSRLNDHTSLAFTASALGVCGFGVGIFISPNNSALMGSAPRHRQGIAAGILATARNVGMVLGVGLSGAVYATVLEKNIGSTGSNLFPAIQASFLTASIFALVGLATSALRSSQKPPD